MNDQTRETRDSLTSVLASASRELNEQTKAVAAPQPSASAHPPSHNQEDSGERFVLLSDHLGEVMLEAARAQLTLAENHVREVEAFVEELRHNIKKKWTEYQELVRRLEDFSTEILEAHRRFHNGAGNVGGKR